LDLALRIVWWQSSSLGAILGSIAACMASWEEQTVSDHDIFPFELLLEVFTPEVDQGETFFGVIWVSFAA
jgi:hypothetical protein